MKFSSFRGYFDQLHNILYLSILVPLLLFGYTYLQVMAADDSPGNETPIRLLSPTLIIVFCIIMILSARLFSGKLKASRELPELSAKMEHYATATIVRFLMFTLATLFLAAGFSLTHEKVFVALFGVSIILFSWWWPTPRKVCKDLHLKGEEHQRVLLRKD